MSYAGSSFSSSGSLGKEMISRLISAHDSECTTSYSSDTKIKNTKTVFVYDINPDIEKVSCLVHTKINGYNYVEKEKVELDKLRKFVKKGDFDEISLIGISIKKDGSFKLKPKELKKSSPVFLEANIPDFEKHYQHMKAVKKQLKEEQEPEEEFDYDER